MKGGKLWYYYERVWVHTHSMVIPHPPLSAEAISALPDLISLEEYDLTLLWGS